MTGSTAMMFLLALALDSKGGMGRGQVAVSESGIVYSGTSYFPGGSVEFKKTFELLESGELRERFHRKPKDGSWAQGRLIEYRTRPKGPGSE